MLALTLAVVAVSANAVQFQAEAGLAAGSLLLVDRGQQLVRQDANVSVSKPTPPAVKLSVGIKFKKTTTPSPMTGKEDEETKDKFIRECTVTFLTSNPELLPVKTLEAFCSKTDAVVECRLRVVEELKKARKTEGGIGLWCRDSFAWFQKKYGSKCPLRCDKLMCKASCKWLKVKSKLDDASMKLEKFEEATGESKAMLRKKTEDVAVLKAAKQKASRELTKAETEVTFQAGNLEEATEALKNVAAANKAAGEKAALWAKKLTMAEAQAKKTSMELRNITVKESLASQAYANSMKDVGAQTAIVTSLKKRFKEAYEAIHDMKIKLQALSKKQSDSDKVIQGEMDPQIAALKEKVDHWKTMLEKAETQVKKVEIYGPKETLPAAEDLVRQQRARKEKALDALAKAELNKTKATTDLNLQMKAIKALEKTMHDAQMSMDALTTDMTKQNERVTTEETKAEEKKKTHEGLQAEKAAKIAALDEAEKAVAKTKTTLKFLNDQQAQGKAAMDGATATKGAVEANVGLAKSSLKTAMASNKTASAAHGKASTTLKGNKTLLGGALDKLRVDKKALQKDMNEHIRLKPEIVAQHDLGF